MSVCGCVCGEWVFLALAPLVDIKMNEGAAYYHTDLTCIWAQPHWNESNGYLSNFQTFFSIKCLTQCLYWRNSNTNRENIHIVSTLGRDLLIASMNRRKDYRKQNLFKSRYGLLTIVLRQTWKTCDAIAFKRNTCTEAFGVWQLLYRMCWMCCNVY